MPASPTSGPALLTRRHGLLPTWAWLAAAAGLGVTGVLLRTSRRTHLRAMGARATPRPGRVTGAHTDLDLLFAQVEALHELASDQENTRDSGRVYDFSIRWGTLLAGRLERLAYYHGRGELTADEQARYEALGRGLRDALPTVERLGLARPRVPPAGAGPR